MSRHVQNTDSWVLERRLRPIYDWLDSGNNKKALQECEKVLKKSPNLQCAKALKAFTLLRMGREGESNAILSVLTNEKPVDNATLQAMTLCYREMQQSKSMEKVCQLYETAVKLDTSNEELHTQLFMSYVKVGDFKAQQQCAMALYKQKPKNPYYCWNVMSIVLQATRGEGVKDESKQKLLLSLAERMMKKMVDDNKIEAEQEVQLYILVLNLLHKYEDILEMLDGTLGEKLQSANMPQMKLEYFIKLKKWQQVNVLCKQILSESFDRWEVWKQYIDSVFELTDLCANGDCNSPESESMVLETVDNSAEKCHEFICGIIEGGAHNAFLLRGPYLARFELCVKLQERTIDSKDLLGDILELFVEYFRKFGYKPCCVSDLKIYLRLLNADQKSELGSRLIKEVGIGPTSVPQSADQMQRHIGAMQLSRLCGSHRNLSAEHLRALVTALILHYQHGYQAYGKDLPSTDLGPSDNYALLAAHVLHDLSRMENGNGAECLIAAVTLLEGLLKNSVSNFHAKLLAIKLYHMLGDGIAANILYYNLDVKHLQLDSLGYIHCSQLATTGLFSLCSIHYDTTLKFFSSNYRDSIDHLTFSYKFGSFIKLDEFMDFRERMNNSLHYTTVVVDRIMLSLYECSNIDSLYNLDISPRDNKIEWDKLRDNKDVDVFVTWDPEMADQSVTESQEVHRLFLQDVAFLKLKVHVLWTVSGALELVKSVDGVRDKRVEMLKCTLKDWNELENRVESENSKPISQDLLAYPAPSRLHGFLDTPYRAVATRFSNFLIAIATEQGTDERKKSCDDTIQQLESLTHHLQEKIDVEDSSDFRTKRKEMELIVNHLEVICLACIFSVISNELVKPASTKKSKKKHAVAESKSQLDLNRLVERLKIEIDKFGDLLSKWTTAITVNKNLASVLETLHLNCQDSSDDDDKFLHSYTVAYKEIRGVLKSLLKMLENL